MGIFILESAKDLGRLFEMAPVRIASSSSPPRKLNGGIPQGTRLGPLLFGVMVNDLIRHWLPRAKFVDDVSVTEIIPRNVPSILPYIVTEVQAYAINNNMSLNPSKSKIMAFDFLHYNSFQCPPVATCGSILEEVKSFKFLGVFIYHELIWTMYCDYILKKANRRLYALRQLRRCGVSAHDSVMVYCLRVRCMLEYVCVVFSALPQYFSDSLERIQKRALAIIFLGSTCSEALNLAGTSTLQDRRSAACHQLIRCAALSG